MKVSFFNFLLIFLLAFLFTSISVPFAGRLANRLDILDQPGKNKIHLHPIPRLGGLGIFLSVMLMILLFIPIWDLPREMVWFMGSSILLAITGFIDDAGKLHSQVKFLLVMPLVSVLLIHSGMIIHISNYPLINYITTIVWFVGIICSFNLIDNMDGLCSGIALIAISFFLFFFTLTRQPLFAVLSVVLIGSLLSFLRYNFYPAKIFLGDGGAMFLGLFIAMMGLRIGFSGFSFSKDYLIPIFVLFVPIFDTTLVTFSRIRRGLIPFMSPGKDHLSHRLLYLGFTQSQVAIILYGIAFTGGLLAVLSFYLSAIIAYIFGIFLGIIGFIAYFWLENIPFERQ
ncbi:MAG: undecaprenyl/decaprenyl-phosphate alpha-N-acetylglucosaminyl 1-phosphate transferase [Candidatus Atribacteria bacterium]|nr:undecaprenyl/decaprenyl-phosphate alpha-N-acetylglucosaminyl 1-phosphate transferase [Candidatus Atribacteria bacterium]